MKYLFVYLATLLTTPYLFSNPNPFEDPDFYYEGIYGTGGYAQQFGPLLDPNEIHLIFEVGSRDAIDATRLGYYFHCPVYAFECHPAGLERCYRHIAKYPYVTIVPLACWNETKQIPFYPIVRSHEGTLPVNLGASSCFPNRADGPGNVHVQGDPITVQATRLDEWMVQNRIDQVDLICMDCEGATYHVLQGLGKSLEKVKYIIAEVFLIPNYHEDHLYTEIKQFLTDRGFYVHTEPPAHLGLSDVLFINGTLIPQKLE